MLRGPRALALSCAFALLAPGCGEDLPAESTQTESSSETSTGPGTTETTAAVPTEGSTASTATEGGTTAGTATEGSATEGVGTTTGTGTTASSGDTSSTTGDETSTSSTSGTTTTTTGDETDSTTGGPVECPQLPDATAKPLTDPKPEARPKLFVRPDGYHLIYMFDSPAFKTNLVKLAPDGEVVGAPSTIATGVWHQVAGSGERYAGATIEPGNLATGKITVVAVQPDDTTELVDIAMIPSEGRGPGTIAVQWNPVAGEWGVLWTQNHDINPNQPGFVHARLYFGRVTADGKWVDGSKKLLTTVDTQYSADISDWDNPLIWAGDRYAAVWAEYGPVTADIYLVELTADGEPTRVKIDQGRFSRGVPAWDGVGYGVAWGHFDFNTHFNLRFAYVEGGAVGEVLHLGDDQVSSEGASIVAVDDRFTVSWHDTPGGTSQVFYAKIDPQTLAVETVQVSEPGFADHDWSYSLVHDGCQHALAFQHVLNPSDVWVRLFE
ncbi:hypothetical protein [Nannocystis radixulma]|uniref:Uncharacterized protein n=1 Tax=Nannocystis radixulma TaxID=2995305 RepID=A0ABT5B1C7_9BACT|nr:hypothetical protein [Nannocystis radixulma]MDC0667886.1 hypothetical protein [Nannocystis radixulma]